MRDAILTAIVLGLLPFIVRTPVLGAYTWAWLSMMSPQKSAYGFARSLPFSQLVAAATLLGLLIFSKQRRPVPLNGITVILVFLLLWMSLTSCFAINDQDVVLDRWIFVMKIQLMVFVTLMLVQDRQQIERLIWVVTFSVGIYGIKGGIWTLMTGGGGRVWGPSGGMIEGNNELAVALIMLVPFMYYLYQTAERRVVRIGLVISMVTTAFSILGSQSRGALLGLVAMALYLAIKSRHPVRMSLLLGILLVAAVSFMPDSWSGRMDSIQSYRDDGSAMSRIYTWKTLWAVALDRPLVGAGFGADTIAVFSRYAPRTDGFEVFEGVVLVAHSIYFQMLGEHGFPGITLFLMLGVATWRTAGRLARETREDPEFGSWVPMLMPMVQVSIVGYAVGGAFLSLAYFDLPYYIMSFVVLVDAATRARSRQKATAARVLAARARLPPAFPG